MDYKDIIRNRVLREKIIRILSFVPDKTMVSLQYRIKFRRKLNLQNPCRFTEKIQWYKLYYYDPLMKKCVDKYEVRKYIQSLGLESILNECYGVYKQPEEIDFKKLPKSFVIKDTLGGGGNAVIIVPDKNKINKKVIRKQMKNWVKISTKTKHPGREWVYDGRKHRIIIEKYLVTDKSDELIEYKFFCFNGKVHYLYVLTDRELGKGVRLGVYTRDYQRLPVSRLDERPLLKDIPCPADFRKMIEMAELISKKFPEARIDFFYIRNKIIFGEITFFDGSGYMKFDPDEFDIVLGRPFILPQIPGNQRK